MTRNLGQTALPRKRRRGDPMHRFDALPAPLRHWLSQAALPWSPVSAGKIWARARARGLNTDQALALLCQAESLTLAREKQALFQPPHPTS